MKQRKMKMKMKMKIPRHPHRLMGVAWSTAQPARPNLLLPLHHRQHPRSPLRLP